MRRVRAARTNHCQNRHIGNVGLIACIEAAGLGTSGAMVSIRNNTDDPQALDVIAEALDNADGVDATRVILALDDDGAVVLAGSVASAEQASEAGLIVEELANEGVRNELRIDPLLREDPTQIDAGVGEEPADSSRRGTELAIDEHGGELATDIGESLEENIPLDPPDEPVTVPTAAEARGIYDHTQTDEVSADAGPLSAQEADDTEPSLPDLTASELARSANGSAAAAGTDDEES